MHTGTYLSAIGAMANERQVAPLRRELYARHTKKFPASSFRLAPRCCSAPLYFSCSIIHSYGLLLPSIQVHVLLTLFLYILWTLIRFLCVFAHRPVIHYSHAVRGWCTPYPLTDAFSVALSQRLLYELHDKRPVYVTVLTQLYCSPFCAIRFTVLIALLLFKNWVFYFR